MRDLRGTFVRRTWEGLEGRSWWVVWLGAGVRVHVL